MSDHLKYSLHDYLTEYGKWNSLDELVDDCRKNWMGRSNSTENLSTFSLCEYLIMNQPNTLKYVLNKNIPSKYDLDMMYTMSKFKFSVRIKQMLQMYNDRTR